MHASSSKSGQPARPGRAGLLVFFLLCARVSAAQTDPYAADAPFSAERPGFSSSPFAMPIAGWQLEAGYQFDQDGGVDAHAAPLLLLRYGLAERLELQLGWTGYRRVDGPGFSTDGVGDANVAVKWQLAPRNAATSMAVYGSLSLPVGDTGLTSDDVDPTVGLFWSHSARFDLFGTVLVSHFDDLALANAVGVSLPVAEDVGGYLEYVVNYVDGSGAAHSLNGGVAVMGAMNLQYDVNAGVGLNGRAGDWFVGAGIAYRF